MKRTYRLGGFLATLVVAALALVPAGEAMASAPRPAAVDADMPARSMADMEGMAGADGEATAEAMPCCPEKAKPDPKDCGKSACPTMTTCVAQCIPAGLPAAADTAFGNWSQAVFRPWPDRMLASLARPPPPRPPKT
ncbi:hypothetical protein GCM10011390_03120 [Aureimonas endophytica]|uniref:4Fe-4S ferredoxin-type domain-containing protein n=1 Tax=Aureimonas endophytica TaxID=2027858 RepID=A0A917E048_9HYPH|nr:hypothetical protein [Aureimonas endophytica]GGD87771.1 hypothetical protein GCM10011390_03120 [Aureimonas endophytica]